MEVVHEGDGTRCPPMGAPQIFLRPLLSSRPLGWNGMVAEIYRARQVDFIALHSEHVVSLQLRGNIDLLQQHAVGQGTRRSIKAGNINITPAGVARHWRYDGDAEILVLRIAPPLVESVSGAEGRESAAVEIVHHSGIRDSHIEYIGGRVLDELKLGRPASRHCAESLASLLAVHLVRHYSTAADGAGDASTKLARHKLRQATDYINKNLRNDLSLGKISETLCMSPCHFAHVFKQTTGLAPHRYVIECRMERAKSLLRESNLPINEIAQMVGYSSQSHFSTVFRQFTGRSPMRYRSDA